MTLEAEQRVVWDHAATVINDADEFFAAGLNIDPYAGGAGIE